MFDRQMRNNHTDISPRYIEGGSRDSSFLSKKKSVVNIVKIPLVPIHLDQSFKINKNLLQPVSLHWNHNRSSEFDNKNTNFISQDHNHTRSMSEVKRTPNRNKIASKGASINFQNLNIENMISFKGKK